MFETQPERHGLHVNGRLLFGLAVIAVGVLLLLDNLGFVYAGDYLRWWPVIPIAVGLSRLAGVGCIRNATTGLIFTVLGVWLLLNTLHITRAGFWDLWPLLLVLAGIGLVSGSWHRLRGHVTIETSDGHGRTDTTSQPHVHAFALLSGSQVKVTSQAFQGGDVTAILGGHTLDFTGAKMTGGRAYLDVVVWWGGIQLRVPPGWAVSSETVNILGGVDDKSAAAGTVREGELVLRGPVIMGGVEIKN